MREYAGGARAGVAAGERRMLTYADACGRMQAARERAWQLVSGKIWDLQHSSEEYFPLDKKFHGTLIGKASVVVLNTAFIAL